MNNDAQARFEARRKLGIRLNLAALATLVAGALISGFSRGPTGDLIGLAIVISGLPLTGASLIILFLSARAYTRSQADRWLP